MVCVQHSKLLFVIVIDINIVIDIDDQLAWGPWRMHEATRVIMPGASFINRRSSGKLTYRL